jgi:uncharacterized protein (TIGR00369 family)
MQEPEHALTSHAPAASVVGEAERRQWEEQPFNRYIGLKMEEMSGGYCRMSVRPTADTPRGAGGSIHGGILASLVDIAALAAIRSLITPSDILAGTAELNISYMRPATSEVVVTEGRVLKKGRSLATVDVDISDGKGRLFCKGRVQYALRQRAR